MPVSPSLRFSRTQSRVCRAARSCEFGPLCRRDWADHGWVIVRKAAPRKTILWLCRTFLGGIALERRPNWQLRGGCAVGGKPGRGCRHHCRHHGPVSRRPLYGAAGIPQRWHDGLAWEPRISSWAATLYERRSNDEADASAFCGCVSPVIALMAITAQSPISFACSDEYFASVIAASRSARASTGWRRSDGGSRFLARPGSAPCGRPSRSPR